MLNTQEKIGLGCSVIAAASILSTWAPVASHAWENLTFSGAATEHKSSTNNNQFEIRDWHSVAAGTGTALGLIGGAFFLVGALKQTDDNVAVKVST